MTSSILEDAFAHHTWASLTLTDACLQLPPEQLDTTVPGTFGSIIDTLRHLVASDTWYQFRLGVREAPIGDGEERELDLARIRELFVSLADGWATLIGSDPDPDEVLVAHHEDGSETRAPRGVRIAQVLHHGTDHRSQVCTALSTLGIEPPEIDLWEYGRTSGRVTTVAAPS